MKSMIVVLVLCLISCAGPMEDFEVYGGCSEGSTRCAGNISQECIEGQWEDQEDCGTKTCATVYVDDSADVVCVTI